MPPAVLSREEVATRILAVFRQYGYDGASLARLSQATGLGRSSLYHYFPNGKEDMAAAAMTAVATWLRDNLLSTLDGSDAPKKRLRRFASRLSEFYQGGEKTCLMDVFTIGDAGPLFQKHLAQRLQLIIGSIGKVVEEAGLERAEAMRRAEDAVISWEGALVVSRAMGSTAPFLRVTKELPDRLLQND
jgi:TetR/AcrR family transcriptional regulator, lmrAB and yxaGH operons repressor